jgi:N-acetylglucosamine-6-sulfatase
VNLPISLRQMLPRALLVGSMGAALICGGAAPAQATTPEISAFYPTSGPAGTTVTITGSDFTNATVVQFNGTSTSSFSIDSDTQITANVPTGATTGPISVLTPDGTATSVEDFTVRPQNIVLILTDDQRSDSLEYMPNVESMLVQHGVTFTNAFDNNPLCCPTRTSIMTGLTSGHNGIWSNKNGSTGGFRGFLANKDQDRQIFDWLHDAGYSTALIGKFLNGYHLKNHSWTMPGVDDWQAFLLEALSTSQTGCQGGGYWGTCYSNDGALEVHSSSDYSTTTSGDKAVSFIEGADPSKPLFLYYAPRAPHLPTSPEPQYSNSCSQVPPIDPPSYNTLIDNGPAYMGSLSALTQQDQNHWQNKWFAHCKTLLSVDDQVGRIAQTLLNTGRLDSTLMLFTSDNGYLFGEHRWTGKIVPYEESIRVPVVVRDDAVIPTDVQGTTVDAQITSLDYTPTFLDAADLSRSLDGESLFPLIGAGGTWVTQDPVLIEHGNSDNPDSVIKVPAYCGVRVSGYMYAQYSTGEEELYDLSADPFELTNVASDSAYGSVLDQLRQDAHDLCVPTPPKFTWTH